MKAIADTIGIARSNLVIAWAVPANRADAKGPKVGALIETAGATLRYLPPYSVRLQSDRKALRQAQSPVAKRTVDGLWCVIGQCLDRSSHANA